MAEVCEELPNLHAKAHSKSGYYNDEEGMVQVVQAYTIIQGKEKDITFTVSEWL